MNVIQTINRKRREIRPTMYAFFPKGRRQLLSAWSLHNLHQILKQCSLPEKKIQNNVVLNLRKVPQSSILV